MNGSEFHWSTFFAMGGYAVYVWPSYALTAVVMLLNVIMPLRQRKHIIRRVKRAVRREKMSTQ
jgi:heme exporter protein D